MPSTASLPDRPSAVRVRRVVALALMTGLAVVNGAGAPLAAPAARTSFAVGATVLAHAGISAKTVPELLELTAQDIERGYVDRPAAAHFSIMNTSPAGFALDVQPFGSMISAVEVDGAGAQAVFDAGGGSIVERGQRGRGIELHLGFRLLIAPGTPPGRYPWPIAFSVRPLAD